MITYVKKLKRFGRKISGYINAKDLAIIIVAPFCWIAPEWLWRIFRFPVAFFDICLNVRRTLYRIKTINRIFPVDSKTHSADLIEIHFRMGCNEAIYQYLREYGPIEWQPRIRLIGRRYIEKSLEAGQGAILWVAPCLYSNLVVKKGLHGAGFAISHLSTDQHGATNTMFGQRFINRIWIEVENRYIYERIIIPIGGKLGYIRKLQKRLRENGLVLINCLPIREQKRVAQPILNGKIELATGAPSLALTVGSSLLPVFTIYKEPGVFDIIVEPPLDLPKTKSRHEAIELLLGEYAKLIESYIIRYPHLFFGIE